MSAKVSAAMVARESAPSADYASLSNLSTEELAAALRVRPQTIRRGLCVDGHYLGLRPTKLGNRRLLWNVGDVARLLNGEVAA